MMVDEAKGGVLWAPINVGLQFMMLIHCPGNQQTGMKQ